MAHGQNGAPQNVIPQKGTSLLVTHVSTATMVEALAMKEGLALANRMGYNVVQAESDSTDVIDACTGGERWWNDSAAIFADCVDYVASIGTVSFQHCPREANAVAHELARVCYTDKSSCNWDDDPSSFIIGKLVNDVIIG